MGTQEKNSLIIEGMSRAVVRGALRLDSVRPGWEDEINLDLLDMRHAERCILGQLYHAKTLGLPLEPVEWPEILEHFGFRHYEGPYFGFVIAHIFDGASEEDWKQLFEGGQAWDILQERWKAEIGLRGGQYKL